MKLFGFNITRRTAPDEIPVSQLSPAALAWMRGESLDDAGAVLSNAYQQVAWVYRAINVLAEQIANIPFLFSRGERGREHLITSGPLVNFYARPHPQINRFEYWELRIIWLMLRGECMRIPIYDNAPRPSDGRGIKGEGHSALRSPHSALKSVLILDPSRFQHIVQDGQLMGWRYTGLGPQAPLESQVFLPEEVWFEKLPNPFDFWRGMPPLYAATTAAQTDFAAASFMKGLIENNADLGVIVRTDQQLSDEQQEQILAELRKRKRRAGTADQPLLLWSGAEVIKPQLSSTDLQFLENRRFCRAEICAAFGVPEEIVSTTANSKYDVMAGARQNFIENRIAPLCARLEAEENSTTIPAIVGGGPAASKPPAEMGWFDLDSLPIMQQARRSRLATAKTGFDMGIPFNELNRVLDLGFKSLPWGDTGYLPTRYQPLPANPSPPTAPKPSVGGPP
jgi:phage portal protein BeeE